jgi:hypothetical protein
MFRRFTASLFSAKCRNGYLQNYIENGHFCTVLVSFVSACYMIFRSDGPYFFTVKGRTNCKVTDRNRGLLVLSGPAQNIPVVGLIPCIFTQTANKEIAFSNPYSTNKSTLLLLCISVLVSSVCRISALFPLTLM